MVTDSASGSSSGSGVDSSIVDPAAILYKGNCDNNNNNNNYRSSNNDTDIYNNSGANNNIYDHDKVFNSTDILSNGNGDGDGDDDNHGNSGDAK